jgi:ribosomal protein S18 acetylase RimI-like enzyme
MPSPMIRAIEERSLNAWPSLETVYYDGWLLRFANGFTRRANSVNPIYPSTADVAEKIRCCEDLYGSRQQATIFKLTAACQPETLDGELASGGYSREADTSVQLLSLQAIDVPELRQDLQLGAFDQPTERWVASYMTLSEQAGHHKPVLCQMLDRIAPRRCFLSLDQGGETIAVGMAVLERGYLGLFDIAVAAALRGRGLGTQCVSQLLRWGQMNGAQHAYLQVMQRNTAAVRLYARLGFTEAYSYWYRILRTDGTRDRG